MTTKQDIPLRRKSWTKSRWKKELDAVFSKYVRQKYSKNGRVGCYTCPHVGEVKSMQLGHFNPRQYLATRYDERNCRVQCYRCNMLYGGEPAKFASELSKEYGEGIVKELEKMRHTPVLRDLGWYVEQIEVYQKKLDELNDN